MARIIPNKNPIDLSQRKAVGFGFPINGSAVFSPTYQTSDQIKSNLVNYLLTNKGERVFNPNFGADLKSLLFENNDDITLDDLQAIIQNEISKFFPSVVIRQIEFTTQENTIQFTLSYSIVNFGVQDEINIII